jgi:transaldolase
MALDGLSPLAMYEALSKQDLQNAADEFRSVFDETDGADGYVSWEVNPHLAHDTLGTITEARRLWRALDRPNVFIKVPATAEGLPAIQQLISEGINVNITLLFGLPRYQEVAAAYVAGLEARAAEGKPLRPVASVASFFVSRIDTLADELLKELSAQGKEQAEFVRKAKGQVAVSSAKAAYKIYKHLFEHGGFKKLASRGARVQRLLWASTSTKNPDYDELKYMEALIGANTINTVTVETLEAYRRRGEPQLRLEEDMEQATWILERLPKFWIHLDQVTQQLEAEGVDKFNRAFDQLIESLKERSRQAAKRTAAHPL